MKLKITGRFTLVVIFIIFTVMLNPHFSHQITVEWLWCGYITPRPSSNLSHVLFIWWKSTDQNINVFTSAVMKFSPEGQTLRKSMISAPSASSGLSRTSSCSSLICGGSSGETSSLHTGRSGRSRRRREEVTSAQSNSMCFLIYSCRVDGGWQYSRIQYSTIPLSSIH